jgi:hypothetical protein
MAHGVLRREPDGLEKDHCGRSFSTLFFDSTVPCNHNLSLLCVVFSGRDLVRLY